MDMVEVTLGEFVSRSPCLITSLNNIRRLDWIKYWFPEFEFTWLGGEMRENLPKEMDFVHEASNAQRAVADFEHVSTSLYIPQVVSSTKRVLIMEYIQGARVDDLGYLAAQGIDRNTVALELTRVFNQMVFVNGWFHAVSDGFCPVCNHQCSDGFRTHIQVIIPIKFRCTIVSSTPANFQETF
jgi:hypothetical protein